MFYHMPKTAGSSINDILLKYADTAHVNEPKITRSISYSILILKKIFSFILAM